MMLDKQVSENRKKWIKFFGDTKGTSEKIANVLCYIGIPEKYFKDNTEFILDANKKDGSAYICEYNSAGISCFQYVTLEFSGSNNVLNKVSFCGDSEFFDEVTVNDLLNENYEADEGSEIDDDYFWWKELKNGDLSFYVSLWKDNFSDFSYELNFDFEEI